MSAQGSVLYPPNYQSFSEDVIVSVMQRARPSSTLLFVAGGSDRQVSDSSLVSLMKTSQPQSYQQPVRMLTETFQCAEVLPGRKWSALNENPPKSSRPTTPTTGRTSLTGDLRRKQSRKKRVPGAIDLIRERNRTHQARYKLRQKKLVEDLETSIQKLQEEIRLVKVQHQVLSINSTSTTVWNVVTEYFRLFRNGVGSSMSAVGPSVTVGSRYPFNELVQRDFLQQTMTPDMTDGTTRGIDAFMEKWKLVSLCHGDINIRIIHLALDAGGSLVATTKGIHVINESTVRIAFPHLVNDGEGGKLSLLAAKIVGQQLEVQGSVRFEWDANLGRVASVLCKADLLTPLLALLGNLEDVSRVFSNALVTPECNLDPGQDFPTIY